MTKEYIGVCNWCDKKKKLTTSPLAGVRLCEKCLGRIGQLFMRAVSKLKHLEQFKPDDDIKTSGSVIKILNFLHKMVDNTK